MVITLSGDNSFLINRQIKDLVNEYKQKYDSIGIENLDISGINFGQISQLLNSLSLFSPNKLMILDRPSESKEFEQNIENICQELPESTTLLLVEPSLDKRSVYYKYISRNTDHRSLNKLQPNDLVKFIIDYAAELGSRIDRASAVYLVERVGDNQMNISHEVEKLSLYSNNISTVEIDVMTEPTPSSTIFQLLDAAFNNNPSKALRIYNEQRTLKVEPIQILSMLAWQLQAIATVITAKNMSDKEIASQTKMSPFVISKTKYITSKISFTKIKQLVNDLSQIDIRSKSQSYDVDEALKNYILSI